jgi:hypothetical protein
MKPYQRWIAATFTIIALWFVYGCASHPVLERARNMSHFAASYEPTPGDEMKPALDALTKRLQLWGIRIIPTMPNDHVHGRASLEHRIIQLHPALSVNGRFEVLAHESGHLFQPPALNDPAVAQVFAELVGVGIQRYYGSKTCEDVAARYLAQFKWAFSSYRYLEKDIDYAVKALTGQIDMPAWREAPQED